MQVTIGEVIFDHVYGQIMDTMSNWCDSINIHLAIWHVMFHSSFVIFHKF